MIAQFDEALRSITPTFTEKLFQANRHALGKGVTLEMATFGVNCYGSSHTSECTIRTVTVRYGNTLRAAPFDDLTLDQQSLVQAAHARACGSE